MKSLAHPQLILSALFVALAVLPQCGKTDPQTRSDATPVSAPPAEPPKPDGPLPAKDLTLVREGLSPSFRAVASRLEIGGHSFEYSEVGGVALLAEFFDEAIKTVPASERKDLPPNFSVVSLFKMLGLDCITAAGSSSRERADGSFHSLNFAYAPQGRKGLLTLTGGAPAKLLLLDVAPKNTDLGLEIPLDLKDLARDVLPGVTAMLPKAEAANLNKELATPIPGVGISPGQIFEKLDARVGIFLRLDPTQKFQATPSAPVLPGMDALIVLDRLGWLIEALKAQFLPKLQGAGSPVAVSEKDGVLTLKVLHPSGPPPMDFLPVLRYDAKADRVLLATRPALMDAVVAGQEKFSQGADFAATWRDLPTEGNACFYASPRLLRTLSNAMASAPQAGPPETAAVVQKLLERFQPLLSRGQALVTTNQPEGTLTAANTSIPLGSSSTLSTITTISLLSSLAMPVYSSVTQRGTNAKTINQLRQVITALKVYASDQKGVYPAELSELLKSNILTDDSILAYTNPATHQRMPWLYKKGLTDSSPASTIVLATPVTLPDGKRIAAFNDASVKVITEAEFHAKW